MIVREIWRRQEDCCGCCVSGDEGISEILVMAWMVARCGDGSDGNGGRCNGGQSSSCSLGGRGETG